jgi:hypothetical protein
MDAGHALKVFSRFVHIASVMTLVGGLTFARCAAGALTDEMMLRWRPVAGTTAAAALASGIYNLFTKENPPPGYHMWFGIKFLLALHVIAVALLLGRGRVSEEKRARMAASAMGSGLAVVLISAWLRWLP